MSDRHGREACLELFARLSEYLDGELEPGLCETIDRHMEGCDPCVAFLESLRRTVALVEAQPGAPLPEDVRRELRDRWAEVRGKRGG